MWVHSETGELCEACPFCEETRADADLQVHGLELEARNFRRKITRLQNEAEAAQISKRDGTTWKELLGCWLLAFPSLRPTAKGIKSARATAVFQRLESGAEVEDVKDAIVGAMQLQFIVFGKRRETGSPSDLAIDLAEIVSVGNDGNFDRLAALGRELRGRE